MILAPAGALAKAKVELGVAWAGYGLQGGSQNSWKRSL